MKITIPKTWIFDTPQLFNGNVEPNVDTVDIALKGSPGPGVELDDSLPGPIVRIPGPGARFDNAKAGSIVLDDNTSFSNATGSTPLYQKAQTNYEQKLAIYTQKQADTQKALDALDEIRAFFKPLEAQINAGDYNNAINQILGIQGYGDAYYTGRDHAYRKWIEDKQMRKITQRCNGLSNIDWEYIYTNGLLTSIPDARQCQIDIIKDWLTAFQNEESKLVGKYNAAKSAESTALTNVNNAKKEVDKALMAEKEASDQRVKENLTNPDVIKASMDAKLRMQQQLDKSKNTRIGLFVAGMVALAAVAVVFMSSKKSS